MTSGSVDAGRADISPATTGHEGLRERKKRHTREALVQQALTLVSERGLHAVTVEDIAEGAGVSPRTFFNYFSSKEEAIVGFSADEPSRLLALLQARPDDETPFRAMCRALLESIAPLESSFEQWSTRDRLTHEHPELSYRYLTGLAKRDEMLVAEVRRRLGDAPDALLHARILVSSVMGAVRVAMTTWNESPSDHTLTEVLRITLDELARGFRGRR
jgi:AcrR family transcriptional regulator